ncbi:haloacid dehalogenase [Oscillospiraceae bacterium]|nr:haloacid dehalogenase [Oscillospiraceae bacterium]
MNIKLIAMDMDGTLLDANHVTVPQRNITALRAASRLGVALAIASGRTWSLISDAVEQLGLMDYALVGNGAAVRDVRGRKRIYEKCMPNAQALDIIRILQRHRLPFEVYCAGQNYVERGDVDLVRPHCLSPEFTALFTEKTLFPEKLADALAGRDVEKFNIFHVPLSERKQVEREVLATGALEIANAFAQNMELAAGGVNKGTALQALAAHLGLGPEQVMAFGDAGNDLEMLSWAGWSFAMDNASPQAKAAAKYRTAANTEAGVGQAVEKYVLEQA